MSETRPTIVVIDGYTLNPGDLSWNKFQALGNTIIYDHTPPEMLIERAKEADIIVVNKAVISSEILERLPKLKCICLTATGYNNIEIQAAKERRITVCNVVGYGSNSVAQHVFALLLTLTNQIYRHHQSVQKGDWANCRDFSYTLCPIMELAGKTFGIYGFGKIGQKVAEIALAFGMNVIATHKHPKRDARPNVKFVELEMLFRQSDVLSLHAPLTAENEGIIHRETLRWMKPSAFIINTGRGGLIREKDLKAALEKSQIAGAALDVLSVEPPPRDHILYGIPNCIITPHIAWASIGAREKLMDISVENVRAFLKGEVRNVVG